MPLATVKRHSAELFENVGRAVATVDLALEDFDHPAIHRKFHWDLACAAEVVREYRPLIKDAQLGAVIDAIAGRFELASELPSSAIHNDANDHNVLAGGGGDLYSRNQNVVGIVDFGDMVHSYTVAGLAIAMAYAVLEKPDPLVVAGHVLRGYHAVRPLSEAEVAALFDLMCMRLVTSACLAAHQTSLRPGDPYLAVSQGGVRKTLPELATIHPRFAHYYFREVCKIEPVPQAPAVLRWLEAQQPAPLVEVVSVQPVDLSASSPLVASDPEENQRGLLYERIRGELDGATGAGGYNEARTLYDAPRAVHMGVDLTTGAGVHVHAPLEGEVHATRGAVVLRHVTDDGVEFFTLYRNLIPEDLAAGQVISQGERIGTTGGEWPHVHFQIVTDLLELGGSFPDAVPAGEREVWKAICPDPSPFLGLPSAAPRRSVEVILEERRQRVGRNLSVSYRNHLQIVRGWMQYLYDETGRRYLDAYNNVAHVGHSHPRVAEAAERQYRLLNTNTRYLQDQLVEYAARLTAHFPDPLSVCFFVNSGSEANELAVRLARAHTGRRGFVVLDSAYHGHTTTCIDLSPYKHEGPGGSGAPPWVHKVSVPDTYRGVHRRNEPEAGSKYAREVEEILDRFDVSAYLAETCPSVAGQIFLPEGYLAEVYRMVRAAGGLAIADEVQTGFGRMGTHFWAFEAHDVVPDIVVLGKPIGNGHPLGAVVTTPEIAASFDNGMEFFSTFGGSTVSCAIGTAVLDAVECEDLQAHALAVGSRLIEGLRSLMNDHPIVGDVRGSGLFVGVELVRDRKLLEPAKAEASFIANRFRDHGILLGTDGPFHNVIKIRGPMPFGEDDADRLVGVFRKILEEDFS